MTAEGYHECFVAAAPVEGEKRVVSWIREGLAGGELVIRIEPTGEDGGFVELCERHGVGARSAIEDGRLVVHSPEDLYLIDGRFDPERRAARDAAWIERSVAAGFSGVRVSGDARWPSELAPSSAQLLSHETSVETLARTYPLRVLCLFDRAHADTSLARLVRTHPQAISDPLVRIRTHRGRVVVTGELDISNVELLGSVLRASSLAQGDVTVDLSATTFMDVRGIAELVGFARRRDFGQRVVVLDPPPSFRMCDGALELDDLEVCTSSWPA